MAAAALVEGSEIAIEIILDLESLCRTPSGDVLATEEGAHTNGFESGARNYLWRPPMLSSSEWKMQSAIDQNERRVKKESFGQEILPYKRSCGCKLLIAAAVLLTSFSIYGLSVWSLYGCSMLLQGDVVLLPWKSKPSTLFFYYALYLLVVRHTATSVLGDWKTNWRCRRKIYIFAGCIYFFSGLSAIIAWSPISNEAAVANVVHFEHGTCQKMPAEITTMLREVCPSFWEQYKFDFVHAPLERSGAASFSRTEQSLRYMQLLNDQGGLLGSLLSLETDPVLRRGAIMLGNSTCRDFIFNHMCQTVLQPCSYRGCRPRANCSQWMLMSEECSEVLPIPIPLGRNTLGRLLETSRAKGIAFLSDLDEAAVGLLDHVTLASQAVADLYFPTCARDTPLDTDSVCTTSAIAAATVCDHRVSCTSVRHESQWVWIFLLGVFPVAANVALSSLFMTIRVTPDFVIDPVRIVSAVVAFTTTVLVTTLGHNQARDGTGWAVVYYVVGLVAFYRGVMLPFKKISEDSSELGNTGTNKHMLRHATAREMQNSLLQVSAALEGMPAKHCHGQRCTLRNCCVAVLRNVLQFIIAMLLILEDPFAFEVFQVLCDCVEWIVQIAALNAATSHTDAGYVCANGISIGVAMICLASALMTARGTRRFVLVLIVTSAFDKIYVILAVIRSRVSTKSASELKFAEHMGSLLPGLVTANLYFSARDAYRMLAYEAVDRSSGSYAEKKHAARERSARNSALQQHAFSRLYVRMKARLPKSLHTAPAYYRWGYTLACAMLLILGSFLSIHALVSFYKQRDSCVSYMGPIAPYAYPRLYYKSGYFASTTCAWSDVKFINASGCCRDTQLHIKGSAQLFGSMTSLEVLDLRSTNVLRLPTSLCHLPSLIKLDMSNSDLETFPPCFCIQDSSAVSQSLKEFSVQATPTETKLDWSFSDLSTVVTAKFCVNALKDTLVALNLSNNNISRWDQTFGYPLLHEDFPKVKILDLSQNLISKLNSGSDLLPNILKKADSFVHLAGNPLTSLSYAFLDAEMSARIEAMLRSSVLTQVIDLEIFVSDLSSTENIFQHLPALVDVDIHQIVFQRPLSFPLVTRLGINSQPDFAANLMGAYLPKLQLLALNGIGSNTSRLIEANRLPVLPSITMLELRLARPSLTNFRYVEKFLPSMTRLRRIQVHHPPFLSFTVIRPAALETIDMARGVQPRRFCQCNVSQWRLLSNLSRYGPIPTMPLSSNSSQWLYQFLSQTPLADLVSSTAWNAPQFLLHPSLTKISLTIAMPSWFITKKSSYSEYLCDLSFGSTFSEATFLELPCPERVLLAVRNCRPSGMEAAHAANLYDELNSHGSTVAIVHPRGPRWSSMNNQSNVSSSCEYNS